MHNQESRILQYAMRDWLHNLGWRDIEVIETISVARRPTPLPAPASSEWWPSAIVEI
jgi:hypothetical protein